MTNSEHHEMRLETTHSTGTEEWVCPICGRRFLMRWPPNYEKIILEAGDEYATHSGGKGGLRMQPPQVNLQNGGAPEEEPVLSEELRLALEEVLQDIDFDDWPDNGA